jgi:hypothetical protein
MMSRIFASLLCLLLILGRAQAADKPWKPDHIITTLWGAPPVTDEALATLAGEHYTMTWVPADKLDVAARHGLRAMVHDFLVTPSSLDDPDKKAKLDALIDRVKGHPALYAWFLTDEPSAATFPTWGRLVAYLRERDPAHLAYINLFPTYATNEQLGTSGDTVGAYREHLRQFIAVVKPGLISYDHYHFLKNRDGDQYFLNLGMVRQAAIEAGLPFLNTIQGCRLDPFGRVPTADELRWLVYTTLAYGGRGISYFVYWGPASSGALYEDGKPTPLSLAAAKLNGEVSALSPELMALDSLGAYHTPPLPRGAEAIPPDALVRITGGAGEFVLGLFGRAGQVTAFMVVNRGYRREAAARILLPAGTREVQEFNRTARTWQGYAAPGDQRAIIVDLEPGDGRLFRLTP